MPNPQQLYDVIIIITPILQSRKLKHTAGRWLGLWLKLIQSDSSVYMFHLSWWLYLEHRATMKLK